MKTRAEEIRDLIPIYEATNATRKVKLLQEELDALTGKSEQEFKAFVSDPASTEGSPEKGDKNIPSDKLLYEMAEAGRTNKEITEITGVKRPWFAVQRYKKSLTS